MSLLGMGYEFGLFQHSECNLIIANHPWSYYSLFYEKSEYHNSFHADHISVVDSNSRAPFCHRGREVSK